MNAEKVKDVLGHHLGEMTDGHLLIAFTHDGVPVLHQRIENPKTAMAVNQILISLIQAGGVDIDTSHGKPD